MKANRPFALAALITFLLSGLPMVAGQTAEGSLTEVASMPFALQGGASATDGSYLYAVGGGGTLASDAVLRYDPRVDAWTEVARLPAPEVMDVVWHDGALLVFRPGGGVWRYQPGGAFEDLAPVADAWADMLAFSDGRHVFLLGGTDGSLFPREVLRYDPATGTTVVLDARLPAGRQGGGVVFDGRVAYHFGGRIRHTEERGWATPEILRFDPYAGTFEVVGSIPDGDAGTTASVVFDGTHAYLFGPGGKVLRFTPATRQIVTLRGVALPGDVSAAYAAWIGGAAYVAGGAESDGGTPTARAFRFTPGATTQNPSVPPGVTELARFPYNVFAPMAAGHGGHVYVFGGITQRADGTCCEPRDEIFRYDPASNTWSERPTRLPEAFWDGQAVSTGSAILLFGHGKSILKYDPASESLEFLQAQLPSARQGMSAILDGSSVYLFGGTDGEALLDEIVRFDTREGTAEVLPSKLPSPRSETGAVWDGQRAYIFGGRVRMDGEGEFLTGEIVSFEPATGKVETLNARFSGGRGGMGGFVDPANPRDAYLFAGTADGGRGPVIRMTLPASGSNVVTLTTLKDALPVDGGSGYALLDGSGYVVGGKTFRLDGAFSDRFFRFTPPGATSGSTGGGGGTETAPPPSGERQPCYDLLSCPIGDPSKIRARIESLAGRIRSEAGEALPGAPVLVFAEEGEVLKPVVATVSDASGGYEVPDLPEDASARYLVSLLGGHVVARDLATVALAAGYAGGSAALSGVELPLPPAIAANPDLASFTQEEATKLKDSIEDAKPFPVGNVTNGTQQGVEVESYAGITAIDFAADESRAGVQVVVVRMNGKGSDRIPDPPAGKPLQWFAAQVVDGEGREVGVRWMRFFLEIPEDKSPKRLVVNHFRLADQRWEVLDLRKVEGSNEYYVLTDSLSLFAVSEVQPSTLALVVENVSGSPYTLPTLGGLAAVGAVAAGYTRLRPAIRRRRGRSRGVGVPVEAVNVTVPAAAAHLPKVDLPEAEFIVSGLNVTAGDTRILEDVSFGFQKGQILALLGPSGCGKSTTLKALTGEIGHKGDVSVFGLNPERHRSDVKRVVGYVSQDTQLYPDMTVRENVEYFGRQYGLSGKDLKAIVPGLLRTLGLEDRSDERVGVLSGGQQRRASIAATLVHAPALLILDEPTSGLDPITRRNLWKFVKQANRDLGVSVIVTTHFLDESEFADRVVILNRGKVVASGSPGELVNSLPGGGKAVVVELQSTSREMEAKIRESAEPLMSEGLVQKVEMAGYQVRFFASDPQLASRRLFELLNDLAIPVRTITAVDLGMDDVFAHYAGESWQESDS